LVISYTPQNTTLTLGKAMIFFFTLQVGYAPMKVVIPMCRTMFPENYPLSFLGQIIKDEFLCQYSNTKAKLPGS
jgi:hypothetical protein